MESHIFLFQTDLYLPIHSQIIFFLNFIMKLYDSHAQIMNINSHENMITDKNIHNIPKMFCLLSNNKYNALYF